MRFFQIFMVSSIETFFFFNCYISVWYFKGSLCFAGLGAFKGVNKLRQRNQLVAFFLYKVELAHVD